MADSGLGEAQAAPSRPACRQTAQNHSCNGNDMRGRGALSSVPPHLPTSQVSDPGGTWRPPAVHFQGHGTDFAHRRGEECQDPKLGLRAVCVLSYRLSLIVKAVTRVPCPPPVSVSLSVPGHGLLCWTQHYVPEVTQLSNSSLSPLCRGTNK